MPSSKRSVRGLSVAVVPIAAVAAVPVALGYASDAPSALVFVAAPAAVLSAGLLALSRWRSRRGEQQGTADGPLTPGAGHAQAPMPAGPAPAPGSDHRSAGDVFGAPPQQATPAPAPAPPVVAPAGATAAAAAAPTAVATVVAQPKARLSTVLAELSGMLSLVVSVIALFKDK